MKNFKNKIEMLRYGETKDFLDYNAEYDADKFRLSEARRFDMGAISTWLAIRDALEFTEDASNGSWSAIKIVESTSKYGTNYIFVDAENRKWRTRETAGEFYCGCGRMFDASDLEKLQQR